VNSRVDSGLLVARLTIDVAEAASGGKACYSSFRVASRASRWQRGRPDHGDIWAIWVIWRENGFILTKAIAISVRNPRISTSKYYGNTLKSEFHEPVALAYLIIGWKIGLN
jgi:hypothetical protein